jgi:hypothetical protein
MSSVLSTDPSDKPFYKLSSAGLTTNGLYGLVALYQL